MSKPLTAAERAALAPLLELARCYSGGCRRVWLDELRREAPTVAARLEALLADEDAPSEGVLSLTADRRATADEAERRAVVSGPRVIGGASGAAVGLPKPTRPPVTAPPSVA